MRTAAKRDQNERPIISALEQVGCKVWQVNDPALPDLLVNTPDDRLILLEVKHPKRGSLTPRQRVFWSAAPVNSAIVSTIEEALAAVQNDCNLQPTAPRRL